MIEYFWLICGAWCGIGGSILFRLKIRKSVASGEFSPEEVSSFARGMILWIFVPCLILWILQLSANGATQPNYWTWPFPQKYMALALHVFILACLVTWVFCKDGAETLSRFSTGHFNGPEFLHTPAAFKLYAMAAAVSGGFFMVSKGA